MRVEYTITEQDYLAAQRLALRTSQPFGYFMVRWYMHAMGLFILAYLVSVAMRQQLSLSFLPGAFFGAFFLLWPMMIPYQHKRIYARTPSLHGRIRMESSESDLNFIGETFNTIVSFAHFEKYVENENSILLYQNPQVFHLIPKRELSPEQIKNLHDLFTTKINRRRLGAAVSR
jgi:ABC-type transport system involved in multi-copper enzyme maturation permease subunit